jgi:hypothetical protein
MSTPLVRASSRQRGCWARRAGARAVQAGAAEAPTCRCRALTARTDAEEHNGLSWPGTGRLGCDSRLRALRCGPVGCSPNVPEWVGTASASVCLPIWPLFGGMTFTGLWVLPRISKALERQWTRATARTLSYPQIGRSLESDPLPLGFRISRYGRTWGQAQLLSRREWGGLGRRRWQSEVGSHDVGIRTKGAIGLNHCLLGRRDVRRAGTAKIRYV